MRRGGAGEGPRPRHELMGEDGQHRPEVLSPPPRAEILTDFDRHKTHEHLRIVVWWSSIVAARGTEIFLSLWYAITYCSVFIYYHSIITIKYII